MSPLKDCNLEAIVGTPRMTSEVGMTGCESHSASGGTVEANFGL